MNYRIPTREEIAEFAERLAHQTDPACAARFFARYKEDCVLIFEGAMGEYLEDVQQQMSGGIDWDEVEDDPQSPHYNVHRPNANWLMGVAELGFLAYCRAVLPRRQSDEAAAILEDQIAYIKEHWRD